VLGGVTEVNVFWEMYKYVKFWFIEPAARPSSCAQKKVFNFTLKQFLHNQDWNRYNGSTIRLTRCSSMFSIEGCQIRGTSFDNATHVEKQSAGTRSYKTKGAACEIARKSRPVRDPAYWTSVRPASGEILRPATLNDDSRVARRSFFGWLFLSWFWIMSCQRYFINPRRTTWRISTGVSWWGSRPFRCGLVRTK
jgi:hypothetical protein